MIPYASLSTLDSSSCLEQLFFFIQRIEEKHIVFYASFSHTKFATLKTVKMASKNTRASMLAEIVNLWRTEAKKKEEHEKQLRKN